MRRLNSNGELVAADSSSLDPASIVDFHPAAKAAGGLPRRQYSASVSPIHTVGRWLTRPRAAAGFCAVLVVLALLGAGTPRKARAPGSYHFAYGTECSRLLNLGRWQHHSAESCTSADEDVAVCGEQHPRTWVWDVKAMQCGARRSDRAALQELLQGKWLAMAGDSIARSLYAALLRIFDDDASADSRRVAYGHQSFEYNLPGNIRASFVWAPYTANVTEQIRNCLLLDPVFSGHRRQSSEALPDVLVIGTALWHVLHVHDAAAYERQLALLRRLKLAMLPDIPAFFLAPSEVTESKLKDAQKRQWMTRTRVRQYQTALEHSQVLAPGGPFRLIDMQRLTEGCGDGCTDDGIHYLNTTYDAALQLHSMQRLAAGESAHLTLAVQSLSGLLDLTMGLDGF